MDVHHSHMIGLAECNYRQTYEILVSFVVAAALNSKT